LVFGFGGGFKSFRSARIMIASPMPRLTILALASAALPKLPAKRSLASSMQTSKLTTNVHTDGAFNPTAQQAALIIKTA
jgi:hypothetical protein